MFGCSPLDGPRREGGLLPDCGPTSVPLQSGAAPPVKYAQARNTRRVGDRTLLILVIYDPPRERD